MRQNLFLMRISMIAVFVISVYTQSVAQSLDTSFDPGTGFSSGFATGIDCKVYTVTQQSDGKYLAGGIFKSYNGTSVNSIVRINNNGAIDLTFNIGTGFERTSGHARIYDIEVQTDGKILVGGEFDSYNGTPCFGLIRLNIDGSLDATFTNGNVGTTDKILLQPDGKMICGTIRLNQDGTVDNTYSGQSHSKSLFLRPDGKIVGPTFRLNADGSMDNSYQIIGNGFNGAVRNVVLQPDGKTVVSGDFLSFNGVSRKKFARLNVDGTLDPGFELISSTTPNTPLALAIQSDEKIYVSSPLVVYRLNTNGTFDNPFGNIGTDGDVLDMLIQNDNKIVLVGKFSKAGLVNRSCILRANTNNSTNVNTISDQKIDIYPNPSSGKVKISLPSKSTISIFDMTGRMLQELTSESLLTEITLNHPNGHYLFVVQSENNTYSKVIKLENNN